MLAWLLCPGFLLWRVVDVKELLPAEDRQLLGTFIGLLSPELARLRSFDDSRVERGLARDRLADDLSASVDSCSL